MTAVEAVVSVVFLFFFFVALKVNRLLSGVQSVTEFCGSETAEISFFEPKSLFCVLNAVEPVERHM